MRMWKGHRQWSLISTSPVTPNTPLDKCLWLPFYVSVLHKFTSIEGGAFFLFTTCQANESEKSVQHKHVAWGLGGTLSGVWRRMCIFSAVWIVCTCSGKNPHLDCHGQRAVAEKRQFFAPLLCCLCLFHLFDFVHLSVTPFPKPLHTSSASCRTQSCLTKAKRSYFLLNQREITILMYCLRDLSHCLRPSLGPFNMQRNMVQNEEKKRQNTRIYRGMIFLTFSLTYPFSWPMVKWGVLIYLPPSSPLPFSLSLCLPITPSFLSHTHTCTPHMP